MATLTIQFSTPTGWFYEENIEGKRFLLLFPQAKEKELDFSAESYSFVQKKLPLSFLRKTPPGWYENTWSETMSVSPSKYTQYLVSSWDDENKHGYWEFNFEEFLRDWEKSGFPREWKE